MLKNRVSGRKVVICIMLLVLSIITAGYAATDGKAPEVNPWWIYLTIVMLFIILGGSVAFMFTVQRKYLTACLQDNQLNLFSQSPAGLPEGTVRAMISFIIIAISLYLSVLMFFQVVGEDSKFPEALSSLLGAVVGFYFGSRVGGKGEGTGLQEEVKNLKTDIDTTQSNKLLGNIKKGIDMTKAVMAVLPEEQKKKYGDIVAKLEEGYKTVDTLTKGGSIKDAVEKGKEIFDLFRKDNPARDAFTKAFGSFSTVLGGTAPALAVITTVVGVSVKLVGAAYEKWKKRILNVPITPAVLPLKAIDANSGFTLLLESSIFKKAFTRELEGNDRPFMTKAAELLNQENVVDFWNAYKDRFTTREQFNEGLQEFRRQALDRELAADTGNTPEMFAPAGGLKALTQSVDRINTDEKAKASLHQLVVTVEELQKQGEPVPTIFEKVQKEEGLL